MQRANDALAPDCLQIAYVEVCGNCCRTSIAHQLFYLYKAAGGISHDQGRTKINITTVDGCLYELDYTTAELPDGMSGRVQGGAGGRLMPWVVPVFKAVSSMLSLIAAEYAERNANVYRCISNYGDDTTWEAWLARLGEPRMWWGVQEMQVLVDALGTICIKVLAELLEPGSMEYQPVVSARVPFEGTCVGGGLPPALVLVLAHGHFWPTIPVGSGSSPMVEHGAVVGRVYSSSSSSSDSDDSMVEQGGVVGSDRVEQGGVVGSDSSSSSDSEDDDSAPPARGQKRHAADAGPATSSGARPVLKTHRTHPAHFVKENMTGSKRSSSSSDTDSSEEPNVDWGGSQHSHQPQQLQQPQQPQQPQHHVVPDDGSSSSDDERLPAFPVGVRREGGVPGPGAPGGVGVRPARLHSQEGGVPGPGDPGGTSYNLAARLEAARAKMPRDVWGPERWAVEKARVEESTAAMMREIQALEEKSAEIARQAEDERQQRAINDHQRELAERAREANLQATFGSFLQQNRTRVLQLYNENNVRTAPRRRGHVQTAEQRELGLEVYRNVIAFLNAPASSHVCDIIAQPLYADFQAQGNISS